MGSKPSKQKSSPSVGAAKTKASRKKSNSRNPEDRSMPLFGHKQSEAGRKKLQHQVYLAQESPEATVDLSGCEALEVPAGIYSTCKVLRKEALLLHTNWLTSLKGGGNILDLMSIRVLDLHSNEMSTLPDELCQLQYLQVLNLERNKLVKLPENIGNLQSLQNLNVRSNKLKALPESLTKLKSLRSLDITDNKISHLSSDFCEIRTLEILQLDSAMMTFPPSEICSQGTEDIMKYLCSECGIDYIPPSNFLLEVMEPPKVISPTMSNNALKAAAEDVKLMMSFDQYASHQEKKRLERIELQREFETHQLQQAQLAATSAADKKELVEILAAEELKVFDELNYLTQRKERERLELVASIQEVELRAADLMNKLLQMNEKARKTEELMEKMERERIEQEEWFVVRQEESENLRKQDVLVAMERMLNENESFSKLWEVYEADRAGYQQRAMETESETNDQINNVLNMKRTEQLELFEILSKQEKLQKEAFEALQLQKDTRHTRLTSQIELIQDELAQLSKIELERREERQESGKNALSEKRRALTQMMMQLLDEREKRAIELKHRMREMEQRREDGQMDYWLIQYQRLMDRKPQELIDQERKLEIAVIKILEQSNAGDYIPLFSRHRITIETMLQLTDEDIKQMGVHELGLRRAILTQIENYMAREEAAKSKMEPPKPTQVLQEAVEATAPTLPDVDKPVKDVKARGVDSECCICMERKSSVIFLPCGHVCSCEICAVSVTECPLCRCVIQQRITLFTS